VLSENAKERRLQMKQAQWKHGEGPAGPGSDDEPVGLDRFGHTSSASSHVPPRLCDDLRPLRPNVWPVRRNLGKSRTANGRDIGVFGGLARAVCSGGGAGGKEGFRTTIMPWAQWLPGRARANLVLLTLAALEISGSTVAEWEIVLQESSSRSVRAARPRLEDFPVRVTDIIRFGDVDRQGHVNNAVFSTYFETGRVVIIWDEDNGLQVPGATSVLARI